MEWSDEYGLGIQFMDADHKEAISLIAKMKDVIGKALLRVLSDFYFHCKEHFEHENQAMKESGFFAYECHSKEHERVLEEIGLLIENLEEDQNRYSGQELYNHFKAWLVNHLQTMDLVTSNYLKMQYEQLQ